MKTIYKYFCKAEEGFCCISFFTIVTLVFISAVCRGLNNPIPWSIDISQLLLAWTAFIGADIALRENRLMGLDLVTRKLPKKTQTILKIFVFLLLLTTLIVFVCYGVKLSIDSYKRTFQTLRMSYSFVTMSLPVASIFMSITAVLKAKDCFKELAQNQ